MTACSRCTEDPPVCATKRYCHRLWRVPASIWAYSTEADIIRMAAAYTAGIVGNHPFVDGNKRTGFVIGILFLELNGYRFIAREEDAAKAVLSLAAGTLDEEEYSLFLRANTVREGEG